MLFVKTFVSFMCFSCNFMLPVIYFYLIAISYCILWVILCSQPKRKELLMSTGFIQRTPITPLRREDCTIHARLLNRATDETLLTVDLSGMPQEAVDRTELFINSLDEVSGGIYRLQVWAEESLSHESRFATTLGTLSTDAYDRIWNFFNRLEEHF